MNFSFKVEEALFTRSSSRAVKRGTDSMVARCNNLYRPGKGMTKRNVIFFQTIDQEIH